MTLLDISIVNVALPAIKMGLHAQENQLEWIVSGYALAFGLLLVPAGRLGDARGRRGVFMTGVALFALASAACGASPSPTFLVVARGRSKCPRSRRARAAALPRLAGALSSGSHAAGRRGR